MIFLSPQLKYKTFTPLVNKGTHPFTPYSGFLRVLRFLPTIPPLGGGMPPHDLAKINNSKIERVTEMGIKKYLHNLFINGSRYFEPKKEFSAKLKKKLKEEFVVSNIYPMSWNRF